MSLFISDELFKLIVPHYRKDIVRLAYNSFVENGRGIVEIQKIRDALNLEDMEFKFNYIVYDDIAAKADVDTAKLICEYDPDNELVAQYQRSEDDIHMVLVKIPPDANAPTMEDIFEGFSFEDILAEYGFSEIKRWYGMPQPKPGTTKD